MENLKQNSDLLNFFDNFVGSKHEINILDLGCSGGPDNLFVQFANSKILDVNYLGIDFNSEEIKRLKKLFDSQFIFLDREIIISEKNKSNITHSNLWNSFSAAEATGLIDAASQSHNEIISNNFWNLNSVAKALKKITMQEIIINFMPTCDLMKIDLDGIDFNCLKDYFDVCLTNPSFVSLEINYQGEYTETSNTFGNVDRFMKNKGYILLALTNRTYGNKIFPRKFKYEIFAQNIGGIPFQGDAVYYLPETLKNKLIVKTILLESFYQEDLAVELLLSNKLNTDFNVIKVIDFMTQKFHENKYRSYDDLIASWRESPKNFFPIIEKELTKNDNDLNDFSINLLLKTIILKLLKIFFFIGEKNRLFKVIN